MICLLWMKACYKILCLLLITVYTCLYNCHSNRLTILDKYLQNRRIRKAFKYIPAGALLLDIGCHKGELLLKAQKKIKAATGIDPACIPGRINPKTELIKGNFPRDLIIKTKFTCITALAVFEHIEPVEQLRFLAACREALEPGGRLIMTIPDQKVDQVTARLKKLRLIDGMDLQAHHGYDVFNTIPLASKAGLKLHLFEQFEWGLNNLFVFVKP